MLRNKSLPIPDDIRGLLLPFFKYFSVLKNAVLQATHLCGLHFANFLHTLLIQQLW